MNDNRPDPDLLLAQVRQTEAQATRGRLTIFFGANAGVGKTYSMLEAAQRRRAQGVDVDPPALVDHHVPHDHMAPQYHAPPQVRRGNVAQHTAPVEPPLDLQPWQGDVDLSSLGQ